MNALEIKKRTITNWELCCFCQEKKTESLVCPYRKPQYHQSYVEVGADIDSFVENKLPLPLDVTKECLLGQGFGNVSATLLAEKAVFHKSCRDLFREKERQRIKKRIHKRANDENDDSCYSPSKKTRSSFDAGFSKTIPQCVVCLGETDTSANPLRQCSTLNDNLKNMAYKAMNWSVYARLNASFDNVAGRVHYHQVCGRNLYNQARAKENDVNKVNTCPKSAYDPLVIAEFVAYMQDKFCAFKLTEIHDLYEKRLGQLKSQWLDISINKSRFKEHILEKLGSEWDGSKSGKYVILSPKSYASDVLMSHLNEELSDNEAEKIVSVGMLLRKYILKDQEEFNGYFTNSGVRKSVPAPLLTLMRVLLEGVTDIDDTTGTEKMNARSKVALALSQLVISNAVVKGRKKAQHLQQVKGRETPLPLYVGLKLESNGRQKKLITQFNRIGLSVSHQRVKQVRKKIAKAVSKRFKDEKVVVPSNCQRGIFTTGTTDNIDVKGRREMHGTSITLIGHVSNTNKGQAAPKIEFNTTEDVPINLPDEYAVVPFIEDFGGDLKLDPISEGEGRPENVTDTKESDWLCHVRESRTRENNGSWKLNETPVTFSGYFSHKQQKEEIDPPAVIGTFPIFTDEKADSLSMQKHAMLMTKKAIEFLNPGQTPVMEGDLPLYARQKACQWQFPSEVGEEKMVCMLGFLHLEMCAQEAGGKLLGGSGWDKLFVLSKIHTSGVAASLLAGKNIKRTRHAYHLTLAWLEILRHQSYSDYCKGPGPHPTIDVWEAQLFLSSPTAHYWGKTVREFLIKVCRFIRSQRLGNWHACIGAIDSLCPYFFALGHTNYARWVPVFLRDMVQLPTKHPEVYKEYLKKHFVVQRSKKKFSLMGLDQSQEHSIKYLKEDSGPKGMYGSEKDEEKIAVELSRS